MFKTLRNLSIVTLICFLPILFGGATLTSQAAEVSKTAKITYKGNYGGKTAKFKISGLNGSGFCSYETKKAPGKGAKGTLRKITDERMIKTLYHGVYKKNGKVSDIEALRIHRCASYWLHGKTSLGKEAKDQLSKSTNWVKRYTRKGMPPKYLSFEVWEFTPIGKDKNKQRVVCYSYKNPGIISIKKTGSGGFSKEGCQYKLYKGSSIQNDNVVKTINIKKNGTSDKIKIAPGTYTIVETKGNKNYAKKNGVYTFTIKSGQSISLTKSVSEIFNDDLVQGKCVITKELTGNLDQYASPLGFEFWVINTKDQRKVYKAISQNIRSTNSASTDVIELPAGNYKIIEHKMRTSKLSEEGDYQNITEPIFFSIKEGETKEFTWENDYQPKHPRIEILKSIDDDDGLGDSKSFKFKVDAKYFSKPTTSAAIKTASGIYADGIDKGYIIENIDLNETDINRLNEAAKNERTGEYSIGVTAQAVGNPTSEKPKPNRTVFTSITVNLKTVEDSDSLYETARERTDTQGGVCTFHSNEINFYGAAVRKSWEAQTKRNGSYSKELKNAGEFTVTEQMTSTQEEQYYVEPKSITKTIEVDEELVLDGSSDYIFRFENKSYRVPVMIQKEDSHGYIDGIKFQLKGTTNFGAEVEEIFETSEGDFKNGQIDFGKLYPGRYRLTELNFDSRRYESPYNLDAHGNPYIDFTITKTQCKAGRTLWIGGKNKAGTVDPVGINFVNKPTTSLFLTKIKDGDTLLPGAVFELFDKNGTSLCKFRITEDSITKGIADAEIISKKDYIDILQELVDEDSPEDDSGESEHDADLEVASYSLDDNYKIESRIASRNQNDLNLLDTNKATKNYDNNIMLLDVEGDVDDTGIDPSYNGVVDVPNDTGFSYIEIKGLIPEEKYKLVEVEPPEGYSPIPDYEFIFKDNTRKAINNVRAGLKTTALDSRTKEHIGLADNNAEIIDTVSYSGLTPGKKYTLTANVFSRKRNADVHGENEITPLLSGSEKVSNTITFTPDKSSGKVNISINLKGADVAGKTLVVRESIKLDGKLVIDESDMESIILDEDQTVYYPKVDTNAELFQDKSIVDILSFENLIAGQEYVAKGYLVDTKTGEKIKGTDGTESFSLNKEGEEIIDFTDEGYNGKSRDGEISVLLPIAAKEYRGKSVTAYEELYLIKKNADGIPEEVLVAQHKDKNDSNQTVAIPKVPLPDEEIKTSDVIRYIDEAHKDTLGDKSSWRKGDKKNILDNSLKRKKLEEAKNIYNANGQKIK